MTFSLCSTSYTLYIFLLKIGNIDFVIYLFYFKMEGWTFSEFCILTKTNENSLNVFATSAEIEILKENCWNHLRDLC